MHNILIYLKGELIGYVVLRVCSFLLDSRLRGNDGIGSGNDGIGSGNDGNGCFVYLNVWHTDLRTLLDYKAYWTKAACC